MNVFVLSTGRCGSLTFKKACEHITNYTVGHESRANIVGPGRLDYPPDHIEIDNRLSWFLGRLDREYGRDAFYVHLVRDEVEVAKSFVGRFFEGGIIKAYTFGIYAPPLFTLDDEMIMEYCLDYVRTVNANIAMFLEDKDMVQVNLERIRRDFTYFWLDIAQGDLNAALAEWDVKHNKKKGW